jgi:hypothetical protein
MRSRRRRPTLSEIVALVVAVAAIGLVLSVPIGDDNLPWTGRLGIVAGSVAITAGIVYIVRRRPD